jgi:hypothetical protein
MLAVGDNALVFESDRILAELMRVNSQLADRLAYDRKGSM